MANPNWKKGGTSPNPEGRRKTKHSIRTVKGMVENFVKRNITPNKLQTLYDELAAKDKLYFLTELLPYCASKQPTQLDMNYNNLSDEALDRLYNNVMAGITNMPVILEPVIKQTKLLNNETGNDESFS